MLAPAMAQYKQAGKENNLQLLFTPLSNNPISLTEGGIMYRKFNSNGTSAFRIGLDIGSGSTTEVLVQAADTISGAYPDTLPSSGFGYTLVPGLNPQADETNKSFSFTIRPGYEMHCPGTDRLSPYWGAEIFFTKTSAKTETDMIHSGNYSVTVVDSPFVTEPEKYVNNPYTIYTVNSKGSSTTFGINLIAGFDFYFAKNLSLGAELNFGYSTTKWSDLETEYLKETNSFSSTTDGNFVTTTTASQSTSVASAPDQKRGKESGFGPGVVGKLKLGWLF